MQFKTSTTAAVAALLVLTLTGAHGAQATQTSQATQTLPAAAPAPADLAESRPLPAAPTPRFVAREVVQPVAAPAPKSSSSETAAPRARTAAATLDALVGQTSVEALDEQLQCLAGAVYFESRGEPLAGQLAVAQVVINRARSGRFPASYCGVVKQAGQFSFVRGGRIPAPSASTSAWRTARAVARIAHEGSWDSQAGSALFFHAANVSPGWRMQRVARISSHVFYK